NLELLRGATGSDCAFLAALNTEDSTIADVQVARSAFAQCRPEGLTGSGLEAFPWLKGRLENLRLSELRDSSAPRKEQALEAAKFAELHIGSALLVALRVQGKPAGFLGLAHAMPRGAPDWRALVHPDDLSRVQTAIRDHVAGKTPIFESTHRMRHRNGEWRWVISRATARVDKHGRLLRLVGVEFDITERKLYEEALF